MAEKTDVTKSVEMSNEERIDELRAELRQTRSEMHRTVEELQERLSPSTLKSELQDKVRDATVGKAKKATYKAREAGSDFMDVIRENPVPAVLGGISIGWLLVKSRRHEGYGTRGIPARYLSSEAYQEDTYTDTDEPYSEEESVGRKFQHKAADLREEARERAGEYSEKAREYSERARQKLSETGSLASERAQEFSVDIRERTSDALQSNPFGAALVVLGFGMLAGLLIPSSRKEMELGEQIATGTAETARSTMEKARTAAEVAKKASEEKLREEGIL
jgi:ElaB/YqjD/DUF883 family membrane-anchored ribosome-binding protein